MGFVKLSASFPSYNSKYDRSLSTFGSNSPNSQTFTGVGEHIAVGSARAGGVKNTLGQSRKSRQQQDWHKSGLSPGRLRPERTLMRGTNETTKSDGAEKPDRAIKEHGHNGHLGWLLNLETSRLIGRRAHAAVDHHAFMGSVAMGKLYLGNRPSLGNRCVCALAIQTFPLTARSLGLSI